MISSEKKLSQNKEITHKLRTHLMSKNSKMDIIVTTFYQGKTFAIYQTRLKKSDLPGETPLKYSSLTELSGYLSDHKNYRFDMETSELAIIFKFGDIQIPIYFDMVPDVRYLQQNLIEHMNVNTQLIQIIRKRRKQGRVEKIQKQLERMEKIGDSVFQNRVGMEKIKQGLQQCWKALKGIGQIVIGTQEKFEKHIGLGIDEWISQGHPVHTKQMQNIVDQIESLKEIRELNKSLRQINQNPIDPSSFYHNRFIIQGNNIKITDQKGGVLFLKPIIQSDYPFSYKFRILQINTEIHVGVGERKQEIVKKGNINKDTIQHLHDYCNTGNLYEGKWSAKKEGNGFKAGDQVQTIVDRKNGIIQWKVNGKKQASSKFQSLQSPQKLFSPHINMWHSTIQWIGCQYQLIYH